MSEPKPNQGVIIFALICVAVTTVFVLAMNWWITNILAAPDWCARAVKAEQLSPGRQTSSCGELLLKQVGSLAINNHIYAGIVALCLLVLIVIVVANGQLSFSANKSGVSANVGHDAPPVTPKEEGAKQVASTAVAEAAKVSAQEHGSTGMEKPL